MANLLDNKDADYASKTLAKCRMSSARISIDWDFWLEGENGRKILETISMKPCLSNSASKYRKVFFKDSSCKFIFPEKEGQDEKKSGFAYTVR